MASTPRRGNNPILLPQDPMFQSFINESSQLSKSLKSLILKRLNMAQKGGIPVFEGKSIESSSNYSEGWEALNRQLRKILSLLKVLMCEQTSTEIQWKNISTRNQRRVLECGGALSEIEKLWHGSIESSSQSSVFRKLLKRVNENLFSFESYSEQFKQNLGKLMVASDKGKRSSHNRNQPFKKNREEQFSERYAKPPITSSKTKPPTLSRLSTQQKTHNPKSHKGNTNPPQLGSYVQGLKKEILTLKEEIQDLGRDREQLKEYNILLLQSRGLFNDKRRSVTPEKGRTLPQFVNSETGVKERESRRSQRSERLERSKHTERFQKDERSERVEVTRTPNGITGFSLRFNTLS